MRSEVPGHPEIAFRLAAFRARFDDANRIFMLGGFVAVVLACGAAIVTLQWSLFAAALVWLAIASIGSWLAHIPLGSVSREISSTVEPLVLQSFELTVEPVSYGDELHLPEHELGLLPYGEQTDILAKYCRTGRSGFILRELDVFKLVGGDHDDQNLGPPRYRRVFIGPVITGTVRAYPGDPFLLLPRRYEINSVRVAARNAFLGEKFERRPDHPLSNCFQVWTGSSAASDGLSSDVLAAARYVHDQFRGNQVAIALTAGGDGVYTLRTAVDFGVLYRKDSHAVAALDPEVIELFAANLSRCIDAFETMRNALAGPAGDEAPTVAE